uniref:Uncharacterized protein n=1 Tax=Cacopsylla melanoneura TaxID=428564 RepID=A0A8D8T7S0_9HEMI
MHMVYLHTLKRNLLYTLCTKCSFSSSYFKEKEKNPSKSKILNDCNLHANNFLLTFCTKNVFRIKLINIYTHTLFEGFNFPETKWNEFYKYSRRDYFEIKW